MRPRLVLFALALSALSAFGQSPAPWEQPLSQQRWAEAEPLLRQALADGDSAPVLRGLATVYRATGRIQDADPVLERLVSLDESVTNVEDLARIKAALGSLDRSEALYRRALELRPGPNTDLLGSIPVRQRLAQVLLAEQKFPDAEEQALTAVSLRIRAQSQKHPDLAADYGLIARIYEAQKKFEQARGIWETVAQIQSENFGYDDLRLAETLDNLAECQHELELEDQAEFSLRRALAIRELNQGPMSPEVAHTADRLALFLFQAKSYADAEPLYRLSLDIYTTLLGPSNPLLARSYDNLAVTKAMLKKYEESETLYREALKLRDGEDALSLRNLGLVLVARDKQSDAEPLYSRALAILDTPANDNAELTKEILKEYASLLRDLKRPVEAVRLENRLKGGKQPPPPRPRSIDAKQK